MAAAYAEKGDFEYAESVEREALAAEGRGCVRRQLCASANSGESFGG
jgi:hypothetical protein